MFRLKFHELLISVIFASSAITANGTENLTLEKVEGSDIQAVVETIQIPQDGQIVFAVILKDVVLSERKVGHIFLYPLTGTQAEAVEFSSAIRSAIETHAYDDLPIKKITVHHLIGHDIKLSELTGKPLRQDSDFFLKVGRIKIEANVQLGLRVKRATLSYGMRVKE